MKASVNHVGYGKIEYEESFWTGAKTLTVNGVKLPKQTKNVFVLKQGENSVNCVIKGGFLTGVTVYIGREAVAVTPPSKWYEIVCSVSIFMLVLVWGNTPALCEIVPIVGGAIGGGIAGLMACVNLLLMKNAKHVGKKLAIWLGLLAGTFLLCFLIAIAILGLL